MSSATTSTHFLRSFWLATVLLLLATGLFNALIDPFRMFNTPEIAGLNVLKPAIHSHARMAKAHAIRLLKPQALILGNSRADVGIDPRHPGWNDSIARVYNSSLTSGRIDEMLAYLQHAQANGPLQQVVLSLDLPMFNANWRHEADFDPSRLSHPGGFPLATGWLKDLITALFSLDALKASIDTIRSQDEPTTINNLPNGLVDSSQKWQVIHNKGGHRRVFLSNIRYNLTQPDGWTGFDLEPVDASPSPLATLESIAVFCEENNIDLYLFISPIHASKLDVIWQIGLGETLETWKRRITAIAAAHNVRLWDFSGYNSITTEPFPALDDAETQMQYYWEGSHYRTNVGRLVLNRMFGSLDGVPEDFGRQLTPQNIERHLLEARLQRDIYRMRQADDIAQIQQLIETLQSPSHTGLSHD